MSDPNKSTIEVSLTKEEANMIISALGSLPFQDVYKLIEKIHLSANAGAGNKKE